MPSSPRVLCPLDWSSHARVVLQHAAAVAEHFAARLIVATIGTSDERVEAERLRRLVREALPAPGASTVDYRGVRTEARAAAAILALARAEDADLIVMGTQGARGLRRQVFGSTAEGVLRETAVPTLVVPRLVSPLRSVRDLRGNGGILAPTDFSDLSRRDARIAAGLATALGVPLLLAHVLPEVSGFLESDARWQVRHTRARTRLEMLRRELNHQGPIDLVLRSGAPAEEIARIASDRRVSVTVMGLRGMGGLRGPRPGSIAYGVLCLAPTLLLTIPPAIAEGRRTPAALAGSAT